MATKTHSIKSEITNHLKKDNDGRWLLCDPHLLYLHEEDAKSYLKAMATSPYGLSFHSDTVKIISDNIERIIGKNNRLFLTDLGPGYPDKALPLAMHCKINRIDLHYRPVDNNEMFLNMAVNELRNFTDNIKPIRSRFESCAPLVQEEQHENFLVMIGLTFMNFAPEYILPILKKIAAKHGRVLIASEVIGPHNDESSVVEIYKIPETKQVAFGPLQALGFNADDVTYDVQFRNGRVEMCFTLNRLPPTTELPRELKVGARVLTAVSYRYNESDLYHSLKRYFTDVELLWSENRTTAIGILN